MNLTLDLGTVMKRRRSQLVEDINTHMAKTNDKMAISESILRDMRRYADMDIDDLLSKLTDTEIEQLSMMVDPDDSMIPPSERCNYRTNKEPTGPLNRQRLLKFLETYASQQEDVPEVVKYQPGVKRGRVWEPPTKKASEQTTDDSVPIELDIEESQALANATTADLVDLAAILGLHSTWATFETLVKAHMPRPLPPLPDNPTNPEKTAQKVYNDDDDMVELNWNNISTVKRDAFRMLFDGLRRNTNLTALSLANTRLTDSAAEHLLEALRSNKHLRILNVESNYLSGNMLKHIFEAINVTQTVTEFRAANQRPSILGSKVEMEIARLVEQNRTILSVGLHLNFADARTRVAVHLERNLDKVRKLRVGKD
ncbi:tropomodulin-like isoform X2 [Varroa jacobsoni]|uniref:Tropomodulin n=1 Tax=Varroa destructor TaxID=109461 RepID=A0A7M7KGQ3_VARDE|nr:tropomodulin-like isoform X2 [Varroa destructor]XP_022665608.1 tropomodulin-like isoform X2 [Varroa destructor]XP_022693669.1 tropomodulin-like isoform X2 [Varroa jacobsoni]XP_022693670.1 tropomodulin-like isoform X2 [Varroa jacobsoni]